MTACQIFKLQNRCKGDQTARRRKSIEQLGLCGTATRCAADDIAEAH